MRKMRRIYHLNCMCPSARVLCFDNQHCDRHVAGGVCMCRGLACMVVHANLHLSLPKNSDICTQRILPNSDPFFEVVLEW